MFALLERNQGVFALSLWVFFPGSLNIASSHCSAQPVLRWLLFASGPLLNLKFLSIFLLKVWKFLIIFIFLGSRIAADGDCSHEIKQALAPWKKSYDKLRQHIKKQRYYFANKGMSSQSYGFSSGRVQIWDLGHKGGWEPKNWCFWTVVLKKTLQLSDWTITTANQFYPLLSAFQVTTVQNQGAFFSAFLHIHKVLPKHSHYLLLLFYKSGSVCILCISLFSLNSALWKHFLVSWYILM